MRPLTICLVSNEYPQSHIMAVSGDVRLHLGQHFTVGHSVRLTSAVHLQNGASLPRGLPSRCPPFWQVQPLVREHGYLPRLRAQYVLAGTKVDVGDLLAFARSLRVKGYVKPAGSPHF